MRATVILGAGDVRVENVAGAKTQAMSDSSFECPSLDQSSELSRLLNNNLASTGLNIIRPDEVTQSSRHHFAGCTQMGGNFALCH